MTDEALKELIVNLPDIIAAIGTIVAAIAATVGAIAAAYFGYQSQKLGKENKKSIEIVRLDVNSKATQALKVLADAKFAEGILKGLEQAADKKSDFEAGLLKGKEDKGSEDDPIHVDLSDDDDITPTKESRR